jgi:predicted nuclease of predicted toxin-antitoxin system
VGKTLKLYLDQMIPSEVARKLLDQGHDVLRASETGQGRGDDRQILEKAISGNRILITLDEHFGDWVVLPLSRHPGVIRVKVSPTTSKQILNLLVSFLQLHSQEQFRDHMVILSQKRAKWILTT